MKLLNTLKGLLIIVILLFNVSFSFSQTLCDVENLYLNHYQYSLPSFIQLYTNDDCISGDISDTTFYFKFYPEGKNGIIYWAYSSPQGYPLTVSNIFIYDSNCELISEGQSIDNFDDALYFIQFDLEATYIDNFCPFFLAIDPLKVDFGMIEAHQIENTISIDWITLSETNSSHFIVQYGYDLNRWLSVVSIPSSQNSTTNRYYTANFTPIYSGNIYIRIVEYDLNGGTTISEPIYIRYIPKQYPGTPIYDLAGRVIGIKK
jgi:hypothetical protein